MQGIPAIVWAALLGSGLTLVGVLLSNWSHSSELRKQLDHNSEEKQKDRISSLRKDVYLNAVEEMAKANSHLGRLPQIDPTNQSIDAGLSGFFAASAKLQLVCQTTTLGIVGELTTRYGEILLALLGKASSVHNLNIDIRILSDLYERSRAEVDRTLAEMKQLNESGHPDAARFAALQASCEGAQQQTKQFSDERSDLFDQHKIAMRDYMIAMLKEVRSIGSLQLKAVAAIRGELGLATDLQEFEVQLRANLERMDRSIQQLLASLEDG
jgi:hypothetical protein